MAHDNSDHDDPNRVEGVDLEGTNALFNDLSYPITADEIVEQYGDHAIERTNAGPITIEELFSYMGEDTFESKEEFRQMILGQMPRDSVGRANYSDRGGSHPEETDAAREAGETTAADIEQGPSTDVEESGKDGTRDTM